MTSERLSASGTIAAPASEIFRIVSHPAGHVALDGSGMLVASPGARPLTAVGETFDMAMNREPLGDIPGMTDYDVRNTVTRLVPDRLFEWGVQSIGRPPSGNVYGWELEPVSGTETRVTNYTDWSGISDAARAARSWPLIPAHFLETSVSNLRSLVLAGWGRRDDDA